MADKIRLDVLLHDRGFVDSREKAKKLIKERNYQEAIPLLLNAIDLTKNESYNAFIIFGIYTDIEHCYKQLYDYEKAYLYSTKRMTLLENFKA